MALTLTAYGPHSWLVRFAERADEEAFQRGRALVETLARQSPPGLREVIPAGTTLLLEFHPDAAAIDPTVLKERLEAGRDLLQTPVQEHWVEIPVHYGGPDLERVAQQTGLSPEAVIERHHGARYRVHCLGFAPGFPYLGGLDPALITPRLPSPRLRVPAGSVAIGGEHAGIYSIPSPGGWNLIGQTSTVLFDPNGSRLEETFALQSGDRVRFVPVQGLPQPKPPVILGTPNSEGPAVLRVLSTGLGLSLQDGGRPGFRRFGVPTSGAMDPAAALWANRLLDNPTEAPVLELCLQGQRLEVLRAGWIAMSGSSHPKGQSPYRAFRVRAGDLLDIGPGATGVWTYLAVPGGFCADSFLGSRSTNPRAAIGRPLGPGDTLSRASSTDWNLPAGVASRGIVPDQWQSIPQSVPLRVWPGPQWSQFGPEQQNRLFTTPWRVSSQCDRVGYRLQSLPSVDGEPAGALAWNGGSLISEPVLPGSIQVPADGQPIVTLHDGPTLGGYPKIAWIDPRDLPRFVQQRAGQTVRFIPAPSGS